MGLEIEGMRTPGGGRKRAAQPRAFGLTWARRGARKCVRMLRSLWISWGFGRAPVPLVRRLLVPTDHHARRVLVGPRWRKHRVRRF